MRRTAIACVMALSAGISSTAMAQRSEPPLLVVLAPTGQDRDGLPVLTEHDDPQPYIDALTRGFSGRLLQLYRWEQQFLAGRDGRPIDPAYLLLSDRQGGFARSGFWLGTRPMPSSGYVDLHRDQRLTGSIAAADQIFPHELIHVIIHQLAGPVPSDAGGANQVHAVGVRTDRATAFNEGFAETAQILALDDPDASPTTAQVAADPQRWERTVRRLAAYRRAMTARWAPAPPARIGFLFWFSQGEDTLRHEFVKENLFARQPEVPERLLRGQDPYAAYLLENVLPGGPDDPVRSPSRLLATEGVVASVLWRWVTSAWPGPTGDDAELLARFGADAADVDVVSHAFLKIFAALADQQAHDLVTLTSAYVSAFPEDAERLGEIMQASLLPWPLPDVAEVWLANDRFMTGTTVFDQYRALPRPHTFDVNAASLVDLMGVEGMTLDTGRAIIAGAPYPALDNLARLPEVSPALLEELNRQAIVMQGLRNETDDETVESLSLMTIFEPYLLRAALWLVVSVVVCAAVYRWVRRVAIWRALLNGLCAATVGLAATWLLTAAGDPTLGALWPFLPLALFGVPAVLWQALRRQPDRQPGRVFAAWIMVCLPLWLVTQAL